MVDIEYSADDPLLMIPGPTPVSAAVREALGLPVRGHATPQVAAGLARIREGIRRVAGAPEHDVYILPGSGTLAMEAALVNHVRPGERVVVVNHGYFADRFVDICAVHGIEVEQVRAQWGEAVNRQDVERALATGGPPALLVVTHVDTSTGTMAEVPELAAIAREAGTAVLLDGVCATGGVDEDLNGWGIDLLVTASQKALGVPPGLAVLASSPRAREWRARPGIVPGYYTDLDRWDAPMTSTAYFATHATSLLRALEVSLEEILAEGLEARFQRHQRVAAHARRGFAGLGFDAVTDIAAVAPTLSVLTPPAGIDEAGLRAGMLQRGVLVAGGIGPLAGRAVRVGHMGTVAEAEVDLAIAAAAGAMGR